MGITKTSVVLLTLILAVSFSAVPASANLLADGSFESPIVPSNSTCGAYGPARCLAVGDTLTDVNGGWTVIGLSPATPAPSMLMTNDYQETVGGVPNGAPLFFHVQDGNQALDLTGEGNQNVTSGLNDGIKQSVTLGPGTYDLSFWLGRQDTSAPGYLGGPNDHPASVSLWIGQNGQNAVNVGTFSNFVGGSSDVNWMQFHYDFTTSGYTTIAFINETALGNNYAGLDNVVLTQTPEPASLLLLASGFAGLLLTRRRK